MKVTIYSVAYSDSAFVNVLSYTEKMTLLYAYYGMTNVEIARTLECECQYCRYYFVQVLKEQQNVKLFYNFTSC